MRTRKASLMRLATIASISIMVAAWPSDGSSQSTNTAGGQARVNVFVELAQGAQRGPVRSAASLYGGHVRYEYKTVLPNVINIRSLPAAAVAALEQTPGVISVTEDAYHENVLKLDESTPLINGLQSQIAAAGLSADGSGARICVVDTGIDSNHIMYATRIDTAAGYDFANNDNNPEDDHGHGAHVSGIALGGTGLSVDFGCEGSEPFQGIAPAATLIGVKVLNSAGGGSDSDIIAGIDHCVDPNLPGGPADVINLSIGFGQFAGNCDGQHGWADAANAASTAGAVVVAAAGNEGFANALASPACGSNVIAVAATYNQDFPNCEDSTSSFSWCLDFFCFGSCTDSSPQADDLVCFSNNSTEVDVAAPGCVIWSADTAAGGSTISSKCGTSMSSPHVAGLAALIRSEDPNLTPSQVRQLIRDGAVDLGTSGFDNAYGFGRIDVVGSLSLITPCVNDSDCNDSLYCTGVETCLAGSCQAGSDPCPGQSCDEGSDTCSPLVCNGNGTCESGENCNNCPQDCSSSSGAVCGNNVCEITDGESCVSCPDDCNGKLNGKPSNRFCCGAGDGPNPINCADARCEGSGNTCSTAPAEPSCCGDGVCEGAEGSASCEIDCGPAPFCGDGQCNGSEDQCVCSGDCGVPPAVELVGFTCNDGVDNDCNDGADCADGDCATEPACNCTLVGDPCGSNAECCSNKCKGARGNKRCR